MSDRPQGACPGYSRQSGFQFHDNTAFREFSHCPLSFSCIERPNAQRNLRPSGASVQLLPLRGSAERRYRAALALPGSLLKLDRRRGLGKPPGSGKRCKPERYAPASPPGPNAECCQTGQAALWAPNTIVLNVAAGARTDGAPAPSCNRCPKSLVLRQRSGHNRHLSACAQSVPETWLAVSQSFFRAASNSRHSPFDMPEVSCVTASPFSMRRMHSIAGPERFTPPMR